MAGSRDVWAVLAAAGLWWFQAGYAGLARLPGRGMVGAGGALSGGVLGSGLGSRWASAGVVRRRSALLCVAVFAGHAALALVRGWPGTSWHARGLGFESP